MFQSPHQGVSEEEWRTVAVIFRLSCNILTTPPHAEGQSSPTHSLISGVRLPASACSSYLCAFTGSLCLGGTLIG